MNKKILAHTTTTLAVLVATFGLLAMQHAAASGNSWSHRGKTSFDGHIYFCGPLMPPVSVEKFPNGKEIRTFINVDNRWVTGNELVDGVEENEVRALVDTSTIPETPIITRINLQLEPSVFDGRWYMRQLITHGPEGDLSRGFGFGTGDLRGKFAWFTTGAFEFPFVDFPPEESPCGPTVRVALHGRVISFHWIS